MKTLKPMVEISGLNHSRDGQPVLHDVNISIVQGETVAIVGPSGSGKSTLLDTILGTLFPDTGTVIVNDSVVVEPSKERGIVYQKYTLFDHLTVEQNVAFGPLLERTSLPQRFFHTIYDLPVKIARSTRWTRAWRNTLEDPFIQEAHRRLQQVGMLHAAKKYPNQLSGGMQQRVAIAQCLIMDPKVILMDEPFGALDGKTRSDCQRLMLDIGQRNIESVMNNEEPPVTVVFVTHDLEEAIKIANRVIAISQFHPEGEKGATVVFDQATPAFDPLNPVEFDFPKAVAMEQEIRAAAMDPLNLGPKSQFLTFMRDAELGKVGGVYGRRSFTF